MIPFRYVDGILHAEEVDLTRLAAEVGTPFYCYSSSALEHNYRAFAQAFSHGSFRGLDTRVCYAIKANSNQAVIATLARLGAGMDVVSEGELRRALLAGVPADKIIFAGVGKTWAEMAFALTAGIGSFNIESEPELHALAEVAARMGTTARVAIRVNPDVEAGGHAKIATGGADDKFGIAYDAAPALYAKAAALPGLAVTGIHMHIGSQITELAPFREAFGRLRTLALDLRRAGHVLHHLDLGGGLGIAYTGANDIPPRPEEYAAVVRESVGDLGLELVFEPGRNIVGNAGILVARVLYMKQAGPKTFAIVDAAMTELIRPTLYQAHHEIRPIREPLPGCPMTPLDVVGPVCESGDYLAEDRPMPPLAQGDLIAVMSAGAYGAVQGSTYNSRPLAPEVMVKGLQWAIVRPRQTYDELIGLDRLAPWLA